MIKLRAIKTVVLFGGAGLVGTQVARQIAQKLSPETIVICALTKEEVDPAVEKLQREFLNIKHIVGEFGNLFVREEFSQIPRSEISTNEG